MPAADAFVESLGRGLAPSNGWLGAYLNYVEPQTDAPEIYHLAVALGILAGALGNRCHVEAFGQRVFPATWNILLGPSTVTRKTHSIRLGMRVLHTMDGNDRVMGEKPERGSEIPEFKSKEALEDLLYARASGVLVMQEFGEFLANAGREHMASTKEMLTRCYDGDPFAVTSRKDGTRIITDPAVTILAASTPEWIEDKARDSDVRGGFLARFLWWPANREDKNAEVDPFISSRAEMERRRLASVLTTVRKYKGEFLIDPAAQTLYRDWLRTHEATDFPERLRGYQGRMPINVLKLAMCLEASSGQAIRPLISASIMQHAIRLANWLMGRVVDLFTERLVFSQQGGRQRQLLEAIGSNGGRSRRDILRTLKWTLKDYEEVSSSLVAQGRIESHREVPEGGGTPTILLRAVR